MKKQITYILSALIIVLFLFTQCYAAKHQALLNKNEEVLISFKMANSNKIVTVATSTRKPDYIVYRFGQKNKIELEYPKDLSNSWEKFTYSFYFRGGGAENSGIDINYLSFTNKDYTYTIYQESESEEGLTQVGIRVINNKTNKEVDLKGDYSSLIGGLIDLRDEYRIKKGY